MAETISNGSDSITPDLVLGYASDQAGRSVFHEVINRADPDVTLRPPGTRSGVLKLFFLTEEQAQEARQFHSTASVFTYTSDATPSASMTYVVDSGGVGTALDDDQMLRWLVNVAYREVVA